MKINCMIYVLCLYTFLFLNNIFIENYINENKSNILIKDFLLINKNNDKTKIYFYPFVGCGFANKIPTLISSILLSLVSYRPLFIVNWMDLSYYFRLPKRLFISKCNCKYTVLYNRKNESILTELKYNTSIKIHTYHGFTSSVLTFYNLTKNIILLLKKQKYRNIESLLHHSFLVPSYAIAKYINIFNKHKNANCIIGVHIRTGIYSDFNEKDDRFLINKSLYLYYKKINKTLYSYKNCKIYIASDSTYIKNHMLTIFKNNIYNYTVPGRICHARFNMHNSNKINECVVKFISENYILSECDVLIGSRKSTFFSLACNRNYIRCISV